MTHSLTRAALAALLCHLPLVAQATDYPATVTDLEGRQVTIPAEPQRIVVQDGRDLFALALLDRDDPLKRVVAWNNIVSRSDARTWKVFADRWPESAAKAIDMKFGDEGQINIEQVVAQKADLVIFQARNRKVVEESDLLNRFAALNIPVVFIDTEIDPVGNAPRTVALLGEVLNRETEAAEYTAFYADRLAQVQAAIAGQPRPRIFIEAKAGQKGLDSCCFTHGTVYWGTLAEAAGGQNLGTQLVSGRTGDVPLEQVIAAQPDVYVMTGSPFANEGSVAPPFGFGADPAQIGAALERLEARPGFAHLAAVQGGRVIGVYHQLYASAMNIYAIEALAKAFHPQALAALDPQADLNTILDRFTGLPDDLPAVFSQMAPVPAQ